MGFWRKTYAKHGDTLKPTGHQKSHLEILFKALCNKFRETRGLGGLPP